MTLSSPAPTKALLPLWLAAIVALVGGAVLDLAFPSVGIWPLAFVGIAMALISLIGRSIGGGLLVGLLFGFSFYLIHVLWATRYLGVIPWLALGGLQGIFWGVGSILIVLVYRWVPRLSARPVVAHVVTAALVGGVWTARELFMGSWPYSGFPWGRMGISQSESPLAHLTSWVGVTGLSFLMVTFTALAIEWFRFARQRRSASGTTQLATKRPDLRGGWGVFGAPIAAMLALFLVLPAFPTTPNGTMTVGSVQGNGPAGYFDDRSESSVMQAQLDASEPLRGEDLDVLLWPEGGVDWDPQVEPMVARLLDRLSIDVDAPVLMNAVTERGELIYNTSMLWEAGEGAVAFYDKRNPVPFGEYVPDRWFYEMIVPDLVGLIQREYTAGTNSPVFDIDGIKAGLAICFDVIYDAVVWEGAADGAEVYMFQTNNADFRGTDENLQQLAFARMRAIETGRSVVNISTVGTSQVIAPDGSTIDEIAEAEAGLMLTEVELRTGLTPAVVIGGWVQFVLLWGSLAGLVLVGVAVRVKRRATTVAAAADADAAATVDPDAAGVAATE